MGFRRVVAAILLALCAATYVSIVTYTPVTPTVDLCGARNGNYSDSETRYVARSCSLHAPTFHAMANSTIDIVDAHITGGVRVVGELTNVTLRLTRCRVHTSGGSAIHFDRAGVVSQSRVVLDSSNVSVTSDDGGAAGDVSAIRFDGTAFSRSSLTVKSSSIKLTSKADAARGCYFHDGCPVRDGSTISVDQSAVTAQGRWFARMFEMYRSPVGDMVAIEFNDVASTTVSVRRNAFSFLFGTQSGFTKGTTLNIRRGSHSAISTHGEGTSIQFVEDSGLHRGSQVVVHTATLYAEGGTLARTYQQMVDSHLGAHSLVAMWHVNATAKAGTENSASFQFETRSGFSGGSALYIEGGRFVSTSESSEAKTIQIVDGSGISGRSTINVKWVSFLAKGDTYARTFQLFADSPLSGGSKVMFNTVGAVAVSNTVAGTVVKSSSFLFEDRSGVSGSSAVQITGGRYEARSTAGEAVSIQFVGDSGMSGRSTLTVSDGAVLAASGHTFGRTLHFADGSDVSGGCSVTLSGVNASATAATEESASFRFGGGFSLSGRSAVEVSKSSFTSRGGAGAEHFFLHFTGTADVSGGSRVVVQPGTLVNGAAVELSSDSAANATGASAAAPTRAADVGNATNATREPDAGEPT